MRQGLKRMIALTRKYRASMILSVVTSISSVILSIVPYYLVYCLTRDIFNKSLCLKNIKTYVFYAAISVIGNLFFMIISTKLSHTVAYNILYELRLKLAKKLTKLPFGYFNNNNVGGIKKIFSENIEKLEAFIAHNIPELMGAIIAFLANTIFLFYMDWRMALATILIVPIMFLSQAAMYKGVDKIMEQYNIALINMNDSIIQYTNGMAVIKAFNQTTSSFSKFKDSVEYYADFEHKWGKRSLKGFSMFTTLMESGIITILPVGVILYLKGSLSMAMFTFFLIMGMGYTKPLNKVMVMGDEFSLIIKGEEELNKVFELKELEVRDKKEKPKSYDVKFNNVCFSYDGQGENVLNNISFEAKQGTTTALIGSSGAGKSTVAKLIPRFWDVDNGSITIGGVDIRNIDTKELMNSISFVFQENFLFNMSIMDNIRFGKPEASKDEVIAAAKVAQCHEFIINLKDGYETNLGVGGLKLSGGEKQRIAIARAILKDSPIVILDEATSAADPENEDKIQEGISKLIKNKTVIVIAHRLLTIVDSDNIILLDKGEISSQGSHNKLLEENSLYKKMYTSYLEAYNWKFGNGGEQND